MTHIRCCGVETIYTNDYLKMENLVIDIYNPNLKKNKKQKKPCRNYPTIWRVE